ncbi:hypothetical protein KU306_10125 [Haloferax larsenii]|uniref:Sec-independent protein translocase protein TatA n=1 Tax=Haloferax larsenii TaxID=302484 RepID=A0ABY5RAF1_HALLR|nr:hypothetical protein [Haloferax larsenii]UVE49281.1 hypothetical protein KU306_10125 [Haloferax larsenii]
MVLSPQFPGVLAIAVPFVLALVLVGGLAVKSILARVSGHEDDLEQRVEELEARVEELSDE